MRVNGRIWSRICGVASRTSGSTALLAGVELAERRAQRLSVGASALAEVSTFSSVSLVWRSAPGSLCTALGDLVVLRGERLEHRVGRAHQPHDLAVLGGQLGGQQAVLVDQVLEVALRRRATAVLTRARSRLSGPEAGEGLLQVAAAALQALAGAGDQQLAGSRACRCRARTGSRRDRCRAPCWPTGSSPFSGSGLPLPGSTSRNMSFRPVLVRSSAVASLLDVALVLGLELELDHAPCRPRARPCRSRRSPRRRCARSGPGPAARPGRRRSSTLTT